MAEHRFVTVEGIRTHYVAVGEGPPLLLLHGLGASLVAWAANIGPLSQRFRVYAVDIPGHGDSARPDMEYVASAGNRFAQALMQALGIERASLIGNSAGGMMALRTALDFPDLVDKLVLVDAAGLGRDLAWSLRLVTLPVVGELLEIPSLGRTRAMLRNVFHDHSFIQDDLLHELYRTRSMPGARRAVLKGIRSAVTLGGLRREWVMAEHLLHLDVPVLVVWGAQDRIVPLHHALEVAELAPGVRLCIFDHCGHWPQMEKSAEFNQVVMDFLCEA